MTGQTLNIAEKQGLKFMEYAKCNSISDLRKISAEELQQLSNSNASGRFGVTLDGYVLPSNILEHFQNKKHNQVPIMTGWVTGDGSFGRKQNDRRRIYKGGSNKI